MLKSLEIKQKSWMKKILTNNTHKHNTHIGFINTQPSRS